MIVFEIDDATQFSKYIYRGMVEESKIPQISKPKSLE